MQETGYSTDEKVCSGPVTWISHVLGSSLIPGLNEILWQSLSSYANFSSGGMSDPGMAHPMEEMTCMRGFGQATLSQGVVKAGRSLLAGLHGKCPGSVRPAG